MKPELLSSVLEIATRPCAGRQRGGRRARRAAPVVAEPRGRAGPPIGAAATHPFARWEDQVIVDRPRYRELVDELGYIARRELIFGTHVHVAIEGADRAIYVADGIRRYLPLLLALSTNSPFWRGQATGMMSSRVPVFRAVPARGHPAALRDLGDLLAPRRADDAQPARSRTTRTCGGTSGPHPNLGTVETRVCDQQTSLDADPRAGRADRVAGPPALRAATTPRSRSSNTRRS